MSQEKPETDLSFKDFWPEGLSLTLWTASLPILGLQELDWLPSHWLGALKTIAAVLLIAIPLIYLIRRIKPLAGFLKESARDLKANNQKLDALASDLSDLQTESAQLRQEITNLQRFTSLNSEIVEQGFMGLQQRAMRIESLPADRGAKLYVVSRHLASHFRDQELEIDLGRQLYNAWTPERLIARYVEGINKRMELIDRYLDSGGEAYFFFEYDNLEEYKSGRTQFDQNIDPVEERKSRFRKLRQINLMEHCKVRLFHRSLGNNMIIRCDDKSDGETDRSMALLMDLRLPYSSTNFEKSCYGIYSTAPEIVSEYRDKVEDILSAAQGDVYRPRGDESDATLPMVISDQDEIETLLNKWLSEI